MDFLGAVGLFKAFLAWRSAVEILLIAAGLFFLYRTLVRLGSWKIATGILVAVAIFLVARFLNLRTIEWVFGNFNRRWSAPAPSRYSHPWIRTNRTT